MNEKFNENEWHRRVYGLNEIFLGRVMKVETGKTPLRQNRRMFAQVDCRVSAALYSRPSFVFVEAKKVDAQQEGHAIDNDETEQQRKAAPPNNKIKETLDAANLTSHHRP